MSTPLFAPSSAARSVNARSWVRRALFVALGLLVSLDVEATSYVPISDANLADQAGLIVRGRVVAREAGPVGVAPATDYTVEIERVLKGFAPGSTVIVRLPGGPSEMDENGLELRVLGAPRFEPFDRAVLFLSPRPDGTFGVVHLMLGAFRVEKVGKQPAVAMRQLLEAIAIDGEDTTEPVRGFAAFERWIEDRAAGVERAADYAVAEPRATGIRRRVERAQRARLGSSQWHWPTLAEDAAIAWRVLPVATQADGLRGAIESWNANATRVRLRDGGTVASSAGFARFDDANVFSLEDSSTGVSGSFSCSAGGLVTVSGVWMTPGEGDGSAVALGADLATLPGTSCRSSQTGSVLASELAWIFDARPLRVSPVSRERGSRIPARSGR